MSKEIQQKSLAFDIDIEKLKKEYKHDPFKFYLISRMYDCKLRRETFWNHYSVMRYRSNLINIPLLFLTSATGLTSISQINKKNNIFN